MNTYIHLRLLKRLAPVLDLTTLETPNWSALPLGRGFIDLDKEKVRETRAVRDLSSENSGPQCVLFVSLICGKPQG